MTAWLRIGKEERPIVGIRVRVRGLFVRYTVRIIPTHSSTAQLKAKVAVLCEYWVESEVTWERSINQNRNLKKSTTMNLLWKFNHTKLHYERYFNVIIISRLELFIMASEVEETLKRLVAHKGVIGTIVVNTDGVPIKSTLDNATTVQYSGLLNNLVDQVRLLGKIFRTVNNLFLLPGEDHV